MKTRQICSLAKVINKFMMNPAEQYSLDCLKKGLTPSGRKLSLFKDEADKSHVYSMFIGYTPVCQWCFKNKAGFKSYKKGFSKYCSMSCSTAAMSNRNTKTNAIRNKKESKKRHEAYLAKMEMAAIEYKEDDFLTIDCLSKKYNIPKTRLRKYLSDLGLTSKNRSAAIRIFTQKEAFKNIDAALSNKSWVNEKISEGWNSKNFADTLGCSKNYVVSFLRDKMNSPLKSGNSSSYEIDLVNHIENFGIQVDRNTRKVISPMELDIFIESKHLAIEVNGIYWHNFNKKADKNYHANKTNECLNNGIHLLHFFDYELDHKKDLVLSIINTKLGLNKKIYARECKVLEISSKEYMNFCEQNHLQGGVNASIKYGLFYKNELVSVMSFGKSRFNKLYEYELLRFCSKLNFTIIGGASKLFKKFISDKKPKSVISYCQKRLFDGTLYENLGFTKERETPPNYFWVNPKGHILSRYKTQKHMLNSSMSEKEYMTSNGYYQIFDSGQTVFTWGNV